MIHTPSYAIITRPQAGVPLGLVSVDVTSVGNVGAGEDNLMTYALPANTLASNGRGVRITAWGLGANNINAKSVRMYFGTAELTSEFVLGTSALVTWSITAHVIRTGASAQVASVIGQGGAAGSTIGQSEINHTTPAQDETAAVTIKCTGTATADNDVVQHAMLIEVF